MAEQFFHTRVSTSFITISSIYLGIIFLHLAMMARRPTQFACLCFPGYLADKASFVKVLFLVGLAHEYFISITFWSRRVNLSDGGPTDLQISSHAECLL
jgi:hypothetical protein